MRENHSVAVEQQPCGVQVVERVGLVGLFRAVFAEEVGELIMIAADDFATNLDTKNCPINPQTVLVRRPRLSFLIGLWEPLSFYC